MSWTIGHSVQTLAAVTCIGLLIAAAIGDLRRYRISNNLVIAVAASFAVFAIASWSWALLAWSLAAAACLFAIGAILFALGLFGGGDTKLITALALWIPFADLPRFLLVMTASGGLLGVVWIIRRRLQRRKIVDAGASAPLTASETTSSQRAPEVPNKLPYGVAIAIAGVDFFLFSPNSPLAGVLSSQ
jgi:prepilin peptidase CpaA